MGANNAKLPDLNTLVQAGIDPKTGLPIKYTDGEEQCRLKVDIRKVLRVMDEQDAINRYKWYNLPSGLDGQLLERILYYKGQGMFFYMESNDKFYFLPYALSGTIDVYGRFMQVTPVAFGNGTTDNEKAKPWIQGLVRKPVYDVLEELDNEFEEGCVLLSDYSKQLSQTNIPRQILNDPILDAEAEAFPLARTSLIANCGVKGMRVNDEDQKAQVKIASKSIYRAALNGDPWIPMVGNIEFQDLTNGSALQSNEYLMYLKTLDNFRLSTYGLDNGGLFEKQAYVNNLDSSTNQANVKERFQDGLTLRQKFCDTVNSIWGLGIWCEASESVAGDTNLDGQAMDNQDQSGIPSEQPEMMEGTENE